MLFKRDPSQVVQIFGDLMVFTHIHLYRYIHKYVYTKIYADV